MRFYFTILLIILCSLLLISTWNSSYIHHILSKKLGHVRHHCQEHIVLSIYFSLKIGSNGTIDLQMKYVGAENEAPGKISIELESEPHFSIEVN